MADHIWTVLCSKTLLDPDNKIITLLDVVESLSEDNLEQRIKDEVREGKKGVLINAPMQLVSWWFRSDIKETTLQVRFSLINPDGDSVFTRNAMARWGDESITLRVFFRLNNLPVSVLGLHWMVVEHLRTMESEEPQWFVASRIPLGIEESIARSAVSIAP
jgi:hypothetical protein